MDCLRGIWTMVWRAPNAEVAALREPFQSEAQDRVLYKSEVPAQSVEARIRCNIDTLLKEQIPEKWIKDREVNKLHEYLSGSEDEQFFKLITSPEYPGDGFWETSPETQSFEYKGRKYTSYREFIVEELCMYALVDKKWTKKLAEELGRRGITQCLEVCAGRGWLSKALAEQGVGVISTDIDPDNPVFEVEKIGAKHAIRKYKDKVDALIIAWPTAKPAGIAINAWKLGKPVIYIGEGAQGCTADIDFFQHFKIEDFLETPRWECILDVCMIGKKVDFSDDYDMEICLKETLKARHPGYSSQHKH